MKLDIVLIIGLILIIRYGLNQPMMGLDLSKFHNSFNNSNDNFIKNSRIDNTPPNTHINIKSNILEDLDNTETEEIKFNDILNHNNL